MNEESKFLRWFVEYPKRWIIVIIGTLLVGFVTLLPAVDNYIAQQGRQADLSVQLAEMEAELQQRDSFAELARRKEADLQSVEQKLVAKENMFRLRTQLIELARQTGCSVRREDTGDESRRRWKNKDNLEQTISTGKGKKEDSPYDLHTHELVLDVVGPLPRLEALLEEIAKIDKLKKVESLSVKELPGTDEAELVVKIRVYDLPKTAEKG